MDAQSAMKQFHDFTARFFKEESDRAAAVLAAIYLDFALKDALLKKFVNSKKVAKDVFDGPLLHLRPKIILAFALGLVDETSYRDLEKINEVRNYFAHKALENASFEDDRVKHLCGELSLVKWAKQSGVYARNKQARQVRRQYLSQISHIAYDLVDPGTLEKFFR